MTLAVRVIPLFRLVLLLAVLLAGTACPALGQDSQQATREQAKELADQAWELTNQERYEEALGPAQQAVRLMEQVVEPGDEELGAMYGVLGGIEAMLGRAEAAQEHLERAVAAVETYQIQASPFVADLYWLLAQLYLVAGNIEQGTACGQQYVAIWEQILEPDDPELAHAYYQHALLLAHYDLPGLAQTGYERLLAFQEQVLGAEHSDTAKAEFLVGQSLVMQDRHPEALVRFKHALPQMVEGLGEDDPDVALCCMWMGRAYFGMDDPVQAMTYQRKAVAILEARNMPGDTLLALCLMELGNSAAAVDDAQAALAAFERVIAMEQATPGTLSLESRTYALMALSYCYEELGDLETAQALRAQAGYPDEPPPRLPETWYKR